MFLIFSTSVVFAKYVVQENSKVQTGIAKPIVELIEGECVNIDSTKTEANYNFTVRNYNEQGIITSAKMNYEIQITAPQSEAITYTLYKNNEMVPINGNSQLLGNKAKEEHMYTLNIKYEKEKNVNLEDIVQEIQIKVHSEQER